MPLRLQAVAACNTLLELSKMSTNKNRTESVIGILFASTYITVLLSSILQKKSCTNKMIVGPVQKKKKKSALYDRCNKPQSQDVRTVIPDSVVHSPYCEVFCCNLFHSVCHLSHVIPGLVNCAAFQIMSCPAQPQPLGGISLQPWILLFHFYFFK
jgi:hypothetical protein